MISCILVFLGKSIVGLDGEYGLIGTGGGEGDGEDKFIAGNMRLVVVPEVVGVLFGDEAILLFSALLLGCGRP